MDTEVDAIVEASTAQDQSEYTNETTLHIEPLGSVTRKKCISGKMALEYGSTSIGRRDIGEKGLANIRIRTSSPLLSRLHCTIEYTESGLTVRDMNSHSGITVNGIHIGYNCGGINGMSLQHGKHIINLGPPTSPFAFLLNYTKQTTA